MRWRYLRPTLPGARMAVSNNLESLATKARTDPERFVEFLRVPSMSLGVYVLAPNATDTQTPHTEDEIYLVHRGRARFRHGVEDDPVSPGDVLFVPARQDHRFHSITEELVLLVVFAPAEGTRR